MHAPVRVGIGYDSHRFVEGHGVILGGVLIPATVRCTGHSDADAVCHALTDAMLFARGVAIHGAQQLPDLCRLDHCSKVPCNVWL